MFVFKLKGYFFLSQHMETFVTRRPHNNRSTADENGVPTNFCWQWKVPLKNVCIGCLSLQCWVSSDWQIDLIAKLEQSPILPDAIKKTFEHGLPVDNYQWISNIRDISMPSLIDIGGKLSSLHFNLTFEIIYRITVCRLLHFQWGFW